VDGAVPRDALADHVVYEGREGVACFADCDMVVVVMVVRVGRFVELGRFGGGFDGGVGLLLEVLV
jgi:hypothetical protein